MIITAYFSDNYGIVKTINISWLIVSILLIIIFLFNNYIYFMIMFTFIIGLMNSVSNLHFVIFYDQFSKNLRENNTVLTFCSYGIGTIFITSIFKYFEDFRYILFCGITLPVFALNISRYFIVESPNYLFRKDPQ